MPMNNGPLPRWIHWLALLVILGQLGAIGLMLTGRLHGAQRNLVPQALLGGVMAYAALAAYILRFHADTLPPAPAGAALKLLALLAMVLVVLQYASLRPLLNLPYDVACWSEPMFVSDIIKWRIGEALYQPPGDSNSGVYTFGAPALTYLLASLAGRGSSIVAYRWIQHLYLLLAAGFAAATAWQVLRILRAGAALRGTRLWVLFFGCTALLFSMNKDTGAFSVFLHNDPLALLVAMLSFYVMARHALTRSPHWLWWMAILPAFGFLTKQYMAIFAAVYVVYLWLDGEVPLRRVVLFGAAAFAVLLATLGMCYALWGENFRYWVLTSMGQQVVSFARLVGRFGEASAYLLPGWLAGLAFFRSEQRSRLLGLWVGWFIIVCGALYTSGITYSPSHLGPAATVGLCLFLAALAAHWPDTSRATSSHVEQWGYVAVGTCAVVTMFAAYGFLTPNTYPVPGDFSRYVREISQEFDGQPTAKVLLDSGEWPYFPRNFLARDRQPILTTHSGTQYEAFNERIRRQEYSRMLIHILNNGRYSYDRHLERGIQQLIPQYYHEVRRISGVKGMESWRYYDSFESDVVVLEPIARPEATKTKPEPPASSAPR